jgi:Xaa-Pro aminopeptidase
VVLIDLAARQAAVPDGAVYAAGTWVGFVGDAIPERVTSAFSAARTARDEAIALLRERQKKGAPVRGFEIDARVREALAAAGFAGAPPHASGHSLDRHRFGDGPDLDDLETHDDRLLLARTGYAIAPGVYAPGEFGVRTGVCVFLGDGGVEVTVEKPQQAIERIGAPVEKKVEPAPPPKPPVTPPPVEKPKAPQPDDAKKAPKE